MAEGFLKLVHLDSAIKALLENLPAAIPGTVKIDIEESSGRVAAEDVVAGEDLPGFARSSMDGYAVRAGDTFGATEGQPAYLTLAGEAPMGGISDIRVEPGFAVRISTGAAMPEGADSVVMVENTELSGEVLQIVSGIAPGENVIRKDDDISRGAVVVSKGQPIAPPQVGALAALGIERLNVYEKPLVGVISTGNELVPYRSRPGPGQVRDINSPTLRVSIEGEGCVARSYGIVRDEFEELLQASRKALEECDAVVISGGSSMGIRDMTAEVLRELGRPGLLAHGIYLKPGKPTLIAVCDGKPVLGLPGNPASALAVFRELLAPVLSGLKGIPPDKQYRGVSALEAELDRSVASATGRMELVPVSLRREDGVLYATPIPVKSNLIGSLAEADGNVRIPEGSEGLQKGQRVTVELLD